MSKPERKARKTFTWATIEQPGGFFRMVGADTLIEDCGDYDRVWRILQDVPGGVYCTFDHTRY